MEENNKPKKPVIYAKLKKDCKALRLRTEPSLSGKIITIIHPGDKVEIKSKIPNSDWVKVKLNDRPGYCMKEFLEVISNAGTKQ